MRKREALTFRPYVSHHDDHRNGLPALPAPGRRQPVDIRKIDGQYLDAALFKQFSKVGYWIDSKAPMRPEGASRVFRIGHVLHRIRRFTRPVPYHARKAKRILERQVTL